MNRRPPRTTRADTLFPYLTLVRSNRAVGDFRADGAGDRAGRVVRTDPGRLRARTRARGVRASAAAARKGAGSRRMSTKKTIRPYTRPAGGWDALRTVAKHFIAQRSEERRVGKECVSKCSNRWSPSH